MNRSRLPARGPWPIVLAVCLGVSVLQTAAAADTGNATPPPAKSATKPAVKPAKPAKQRDQGSLGGSAATGPILTKDELRQCLAEQDRMKQETTDVVAAQKKLADKRAEFERESAAIDADRPTVDLTNQEAVDAFNARLQAKGKLVADYQASALVFNQRIDKLDADDKAFTKTCRDRKYFEDEYDEIKAGK